MRFSQVQVALLATALIGAPAVLANEADEVTSVNAREATVEVEARQEAPVAESATWKKFLISKLVAAPLAVVGLVPFPFLAPVAESATWKKFLISKLVAGILLNRVQVRKPLKRRVGLGGVAGIGERKEYVKSCLSSVPLARCICCLGASISSSKLATQRRIYPFEQIYRIIPPTSDLQCAPPTSSPSLPLRRHHLPPPPCIYRPHASIPTPPPLQLLIFQQLPHRP
ncbi:hypothetical protein NLJ89_g6809 [Agrocybe chaxingu]|uniref:Uncharacterized protein n=1 Tax=Agrocybe chaxingu TaxID=84603 RepID=A0A9W8JXK3_9AGAR|nr:hypothetical protein NLJ89_g6809 [Agrocybe chaxingu]